MRKAFIVLLMAYSYNHAVAQRFPPSAVDLRASYCVGLLKDMVSVLQPIRNDTYIPSDLKKSTLEVLARAENNLSRLQGYLLPRLNFLDATGLMSAANQFSVDNRRHKERTDNCRQESSDEQDNCYSVCAVISGMAAKRKQCNDLSWMPY